MIKTKKNRNSKSNKKISKISKEKIKFTNKNFKRTLKMYGGSSRQKTTTGYSCVYKYNGLAKAMGISECYIKDVSFACETKENAKLFNNITIDDTIVIDEKNLRISNYDKISSRLSDKDSKTQKTLTDSKNNEYTTTVPQLDSEGAVLVNSAFCVITAFPEILQIVLVETSKKKIEFDYEIDSTNYTFNGLIEPGKKIIKVAIPIIVNITHAKPIEETKLLEFKFNGKTYFTVSGSGKTTCQISHIDKMTFDELKKIEGSDTEKVTGDNKITSLKGQSFNEIAKDLASAVGSAALSGSKAAVGAALSGSKAVAGAALLGSKKAALSLLSGSKSAASLLGKGLGLVKSSSSGKSIELNNTQADQISGQLAEIINKFPQEKAQNLVTLFEAKFSNTPKKNEAIFQPEVESKKKVSFNKVL